MNATIQQRSVTYQTPRGDRIDICPACEARYRAAGVWPRNNVGQEYCTVSHGLHQAACDCCGRDAADVG